VKNPSCSRRRARRKEPKERLDQCEAQFLISLEHFTLWVDSHSDPFRGKPRLVLRSMQVLFLLFVAVFFSFLALSHTASPDIINGEYVLNSHGKIVGHISERHYLFLKGWELRLFASGWILAYFTAMMNWWFPRQDEWTVVVPD
jgi:hypothetical protein